jgi:hypothetical protein
MGGIRSIRWKWIVLAGLLAEASVFLVFFLHRAVGIRGRTMFVHF